MLIGIMSDSHDRLELLEAAVNLFNERGVKHVIHAGDYVAPFSLAALGRLNCPWMGVFGNNDGERRGLGIKSGGKILESPAFNEINGHKIVIVHDLVSLKGRPAVENIGVVIHGHTHKPEIEKKNGLLAINPGELCGYLTGRSTIAFLNTIELQAEIVEVVK